MFEQITSFNNLYAAYKTAARGKHDRAEVLRHDLHAEKILWRLRRELLSGSYRHGKYRTFKVYDPKVRDVAAAPFTDRIVHHAVVRVIEPLFERGFIYDSYACRVGKGTHAAVLRLQYFLRSAHDKYVEFNVLRADICKFFARIDHAVLLKLLTRQIHDAKTLALCGQIICSYREEVQPSVVQKPIPGGQGGQLALDLDGSRTDSSLSLSLSRNAGTAGQPIGNLTSQLFANIYLNHLDQFVKHTLGERYYLRYMDDFLLIHPSKQHLVKVKTAIETFAGNELGLELHPDKTNIHKFSGHERFVGYDAGLFTRRLSKPTVQRFLRRLRRTHAQRGMAAARESWQQFDAYASFAHARGLLAAINPFDEKMIANDKP